jgi:hypothetical protein
VRDFSVVATRGPRRRFSPTAIVLVLAMTTGARAGASELVLGKDALQALVANALFSEGGRWYLQQGTCFAYLDHPLVGLSEGRMTVSARLSAKLGLEASGACLGVSLVSNVALSGVLRGSGSELSLRDIRVDRVDDDSNSQALELVRGAVSDAVPRALRIDLMTVVKPTAIPGLPMPARVTRLVVTDVVTGQKSVSVTFDLGVAIP